MKVQELPIEAVVPYARNPRKPNGAIDKVAASIKEFGWRQPIVVDSENVIVAGHTRLLAAKQLGLVRVPVHVAKELTKAQAKAYRLMDNKSNEEAEWDAELLTLEFGDLGEMDFDLGLTGFSEEERRAAEAGEPGQGRTDPDESPECGDAAISMMGEKWLLGSHSVVCGNARDGEIRCDALVTDPPYGIDLDTDYTQMPNDKVASKRYDRVIGDAGPFDASAVRVDCKEQFWFGANYYRRTLSGSDLDGSWLVWDKRVEANDAVVGSAFELIWSKVPHKQDVMRFNWCGYRAHDPGERRTHPTQKPVALVMRIIERWAGDVIADPFLGSGTTLIACERLGRTCLGVEIEPLYVDIAIRRWQDFTGQEATLEGDGRTFAEVARERVGG